MMKRKFFIAGNWKMNDTVAESIDLVKRLQTSLSGVAGVEVTLPTLFERIKGQ